MISKEQKITNARLHSSYLSSIISMSLVLFLLGMAGLFYINANQVTKYFRDSIYIDVYLNDGLKESDISQFRKQVDIMPYTRETKYISKEDAAKNFEKEMGKDFLTILDGNPLPESIEIWISATYSSIDSISVIQQQLESMYQVESVKYEKSILSLVNSNINKINLIMAVFILLLLFVSIVLINHTIRLSVYAKRFAIHTMKLVGATRYFISKPFLFQSVLRGIISGLIAIIILHVTIYALQSEFSDIIEFADTETMLVLLFGILLLGIGINYVSTYFAVRKYIRIDFDKLYY
ncbi:MAG: permease-like cell division protein FtsX [Prevotellaceae bacterium]|jgi:cell division transport system permease protein|nr:permease-like cell division protein FtsX [Prevotellaceae bacterium]